MAKQNSLNRIQFYRLCQHIKTMKTRIHDERMTCDGIAAACTIALEFPVTGRNVQTALKAVGIRVARSPVTPHPHNSKEARVRILARAVLHIANELDIVLHPNVTLIARGLATLTGDGETTPPPADDLREPT